MGCAVCFTTTLGKDDPFVWSHVETVPQCHFSHSHTDLCVLDQGSDGNMTGCKTGCAACFTTILWPIMTPFKWSHVNTVLWCHFSH
jgi:hypothetical protein